MIVRRLGWLLAAWLAPAVGSVALTRSVPPVQPTKGTVQAVFTSDDDIEGLLADTIDRAREQVLVQVYLLSNKVITRALLVVYQRGVDARVLVGREQMMRSDDSRASEIANVGILVWLEARYKNTHDKVVVVDPCGVYPMLVTDSFDPTQTTQRGNAENVLIVHGDADLTQRYAAD